MVGFRTKMGALLLCVVLLAVMVLPASAQGILNLASETAVLIDADTGQVLYSKDMDRKMYPASITKVMTGMLALENLMEDTVLTVSQTAVNAVPRTSSHIGLAPGEQMTLDQAMSALSMESANDAANVLAEGVAGSLEDFALMMTERANQLGAMNTHFANANGLPNLEHYTTAHDMALIAAEALKVPGFTDYFSRIDYNAGSRSFHNKNRLLSGQYYYDGVLMSKTGWTTSAQGTLVSAARRGNVTLVAVVMKSVLLEDKYRDTQALFDYGFSQYRRVSVTGEEIAQGMTLGLYEPFRGQQFSFLLPNDRDISEIHFSIGEGMKLMTASSEQTAVIVNASLGEGMPLPDLTLVLVRQGFQPKTASSLLIERPELTPEEEGISWMQIIVAVTALVLFALTRMGLYRRRERKHRRRRLEGKIRQMKKQMEE